MSERTAMLIGAVLVVALTLFWVRACDRDYELRYPNCHQEETHVQGEST